MNKAKSSGRQCPVCSHPKSTVTDSRDLPGQLRRRRQCLACGNRWTTVETSVLDSLSPEQVTDLALAALATASAAIFQARMVIAKRQHHETWAATSVPEGQAAEQTNGSLDFDAEATNAAR